MKESRKRAQAWLTEHLHMDFPYVQMGNIDSLHLFGEPELVIFGIYAANRGRWRKVLDIGANLGLHSIVLDRMGYTVQAYEPDFSHFQHLITNLQVNGCDNVTPCMAAVHTETGEANFVRVLNNLTGNHLEGFKDSYGPRETVIVPTVDVRPLFDWADFAKLDCEGSEAALICTITERQAEHLSLVAEVRNTDNAKAIYHHCAKIGLPLWAYKRDFERVRTFTDMPCNNRDGPLFLGKRGPYG